MPTEQDAFKMLAQQQIDFEKQINDRLGRAIETMMRTQAHETTSNEARGMPHYGGTEGTNSRDIDVLRRRISELEQRPIGFQLPISFRYRNDGAEGEGEGIHRAEFIIRPTPYSDTTSTSPGTTFWPDAEWTPIAGADAEVYTP